MSTRVRLLCEFKVSHTVGGKDVFKSFLFTANFEFEELSRLTSLGHHDTTDGRTDGPKDVLLFFLSLRKKSRGESESESLKEDFFSSSSSSSSSCFVFYRRVCVCTRSPVRTDTKDGKDWRKERREYIKKRSLSLRSNNNNKLRKKKKKNLHLSHELTGERLSLLSPHWKTHLKKNKFLQSHRKKNLIVLKNVSILGRRDARPCPRTTTNLNYKQ